MNEKELISKATPFVNVIKSEREFKTKLRELIENLAVGQSTDISVNGEIRTLTKKAEKSIVVSHKFTH